MNKFLGIVKLNYIAWCGDWSKPLPNTGASMSSIVIKFSPIYRSTGSEFRLDF